MSSILLQVIELPSNLTYLFAAFTIAWAGFFIFAGAINLYIAYNFSTEFWVNFKVYGLLGLTFIFAIAQAIYISRYIEDVKEEIK